MRFAPLRSCGAIAHRSATSSKRRSSLSTAWAFSLSLNTRGLAGDLPRHASISAGIAKQSAARHAITSTFAAINMDATVTLRRPPVRVQSQVVRLNEIPGYREAITKERINRNAAFLNIPRQIAKGIVIRNMTARDFLILDELGLITEIQLNPDRPTIAKFCWMLAVKKRFKILFVWHCARLNLLEAQEKIKDYLQATFMDTPGYSGDPNSQLPIASWIAHTAQFCASEFGWDDERTMDKPLRVLNQLINVTKARHDPGYLVNGLRGKVLADRLKRKNEELQLKIARQSLVDCLARRSHG